MGPCAASNGLGALMIPLFYHRCLLSFVQKMIENKEQTFTGRSMPNALPSNESTLSELHKSIDYKKGKSQYFKLMAFQDAALKIPLSSGLLFFLQQAWTCYFKEYFYVRMPPFFCSVSRILTVASQRASSLSCFMKDSVVKLVFPVGMINMCQKKITTCLRVLVDRYWFQELLVFISIKSSHPSKVSKVL